MTAIVNAAIAGTGAIASKTAFPLSNAVAAAMEILYGSIESNYELTGNKGLRSLFLDFTKGVLDPRINFTRTTNATVTNSAGLITYAPHNLLTYSEQFDNAIWTKTNATISANSVVAPNATTTADKIVEDTVNTLHRFYTSATVTANPHTFSFYAKADNRNWVYAGLTTGTASYAFFDLVNGVVGTVNGVYTGATIQSIGSGWYRCSITRTTTAASWLPEIGCASADNVFSYTGNGLSGISVWGAQLEIGSTATTYNSTTVKNLLGYSELFDNAAWTKSNSFVQTNLLTYSEDLGNSVWNDLRNITLSTNSTVAPNGYQTADTLVENTATTSHGLQRLTAVTITSGLIYTFSFYVKSNGRKRISVAPDGAGGNIGAGSTIFDLSTVSVVGSFSGTAVATIIDVGNGWRKCTITNTSSGTTASPAFFLSSDTYSTTSSFNTYTGDGTSGVYIWGAQLVQGSVAGDYRRTDAAALPVYYPNHNGVVCAEQLHGTAANGTILESYTATGGSMTFSLWMRRITGTGNVDITMDTGVTWTTQAITTSWVRYSITTTPTAGARTAGIRLVTSGDVIQVFGSQVSDSASLDPYVLNAAAAPSAQAYYGARFDYDPVTLAPKGLLIEDQLANLLLNSTLPATNLATQNVTVTAVAHTLTFYGTGNIVLSGTASATLTGTGAYPTRSTLTFTPTAGTLTLTVTGTVQYAQLEIGSFATSFIPTAASQVTRAADVATIQGSNFYSWYNQNEGSVYVNSSGTTSASGAPVVAINDSTANNQINVGNFAGGTDYGTLFVRYIAATQASLVSTCNPTAFNKAASGYKINDFAGAINNGTALTDISGITPLCNRMQIGTSPASVYLNGTIKQISYYPQRLSDSVLKGLTA